MFIPLPAPLPPPPRRIFRKIRIALEYNLTVSFQFHSQLLWVCRDECQQLISYSATPFLIWLVILKQNQCIRIYMRTRMHSSRMRMARTLTLWVGEVSAQEGGVCPGVYHVTYPIIHLMLPVCCLLTNWDPPTVQLLIYCRLVMWPTRHAGIPPTPCGQNSWHTLLKILPCPKLRLRAVIKNIQIKSNEWDKKPRLLL